MKSDIHYKRVVHDIYLSTVSKFNPFTDKTLINDMFLTLIRFHKLEGRISPQDILNTDFFHLNNLAILGLNASKFELKKRNTEQEEAIKEIMDQLSLIEERLVPILIKGLSIYGITKSSNSIRRSADIDILHAEPCVLEKNLIELGYKKDEEAFLSEHEYCSMVKENIVIDIHKYVPIENYSDGMVNKAKKSVKRNSNVFFESFTQKKYDKINYDEIIKDAIVYDNLNGILIPNINYQIIILCTHIFRNYINSLFHFSSGIILGELLDVIDLLNNKLFNEKSFLECIEHDNRFTSLSFVGYLLREVFGFNYLNKLINSTEEYYPKSIFWNGAMYIPSNANEFIFYDQYDLAKGLDGNEVNLIPEKDTCCENIQRYNSHNVMHVRYINFYTKNQMIDLEIALTSMPSILSKDTFEIVFEGERCCFVFDGKNIVSEIQPKGYTFNFNGEQEGYSVIIQLPIKILNGFDEINYGLFISVTRWGNGPLTTFIPIRINYINEY